MLSYRRLASNFQISLRSTGPAFATLTFSSGYLRDEFLACLSVYSSAILGWPIPPSSRLAFHECPWIWGALILLRMWPTARSRQRLVTFMILCTVASVRHETIKIELNCNWDRHLRRECSTG